MEHALSTTKIYFTRDYARFRFVNGNRPIDWPKVKRICDDIRDGLDILRYVPILTVENGEFLDVDDGQNRLQVAKKMKCHIWYVLAEDLTIQDIAKINSNQDKWKTVDYINCYIADKNPNYEKLSAFMKETGFPLSVSQRLLANGKIQHDSGQDKTTASKFKRGKFEALHDEEAKKFYNTAKLFSDFKHWQQRHFLIAIEVLISFGKCDFIELVDKYAANPKELQKHTSVREYLSNLELIYNYRMRERRVIYK